MEGWQDGRRMDGRIGGKCKREQCFGFAGVVIVEWW